MVGQLRSTTSIFILIYYEQIFSFSNLTIKQKLYLIEKGLYKNRANIYLKKDANFKLSICYGALHCFEKHLMWLDDDFG